jgi:hypothetical protein
MVQAVQATLHPRQSFAGRGRLRCELRARSVPPTLLQRRICRRLDYPKSEKRLVQLLLRFPGRALLPDETPPTELLAFLARELGVSPNSFANYAERDETRREHLGELQAYCGLRCFGIGPYGSLAARLMPTTLQTNRGVVLVGAAIDELRRCSILIPRLAVLERLCAEAIRRAERQLFQTLTAGSDGPDARLVTARRIAPSLELEHGKPGNG